MQLLGKKKRQYFASPRQQGAGLINVANALRNEVVATFKNTDSKGLVNSYGSISLKEIKGDKKLLYNQASQYIKQTFDF